MNGKLIGFWFAMAICPTGIAAPEGPPTLDVPPSKQPVTTDLISRFSALDTNHDGFISLDEAKSDPKVAAKFADLDTDQDGKLSKKEFSQLTALMGITIPIPLPGSEEGSTKQLNLEIKPASPPVGAAPGLTP